MTGTIIKFERPRPIPRSGTTAVDRAELGDAIANISEATNTIVGVYNQAIDAMPTIPKSEADAYLIILNGAMEAYVEKAGEIAGATWCARKCNEIAKALNAKFGGAA